MGLKMADLLLDSLNRLLGPYLGNPNTSIDPTALPDLIRSVGAALRDATVTGDAHQARQQPQPRPAEVPQPAASSTPPAAETPVEAAKVATPVPSPAETKGKRKPAESLPAPLPTEIAATIPAAAAATVVVAVRKRGRPRKNPTADSPRVVTKKPATTKKPIVMADGWTPPATPVDPQTTYTVNGKGEQVVICLEDGKTYKVISRRLTALGLTPEDYRAKWGLPADYPMHSPAYGEKRVAIAKAQHAARAAAK